MRGKSLFNNPIVNPFYRDPRDDDPDGLAGADNESRGSSDAGADEKGVDEKGAKGEKDAASQVMRVPAAVGDTESTEGTTTNVYQAGLQKAEAIAIVWGKQSLIVTYVSIYFVFFFLSLQQQTSNVLQPYVYSSFSLQNLVTISGIMSSIIGGVLRLPTAKLIDIWGRAEGFIIMVGFTVLGIILQAACKNVETYAAAQVLYWIGNDGIQYVLDVVISDSSKLRNRGIMLGLSSVPYVATTFAGPAIAQSLLDGAGWRWGFGIFAIIIPVVSAPISFIFLRNTHKARQQGLIVKHDSGRTWWQSVKYYYVEFDVLGLVIIMAGLVMFLLPFQLASSEAQGWRSPTIIGLIVAGGVLLIFFPIYETFISPKSFVPWRLMRERNLFGSALVIGAFFVSFYCWDAFFQEYLQVVYNLPPRNAGYLANTYSIASSFWAPVTGLLIRYTGRFKWLGMCAVPLHILGAGLMIYFRQPDVGIGYVAMCQIFIAFAGGTLELTEQIAALAACKHGEVAVVLAILSLASNIGGAIGGAISGAIWTNTFLPALTRALPADAADQAFTIYGSLTVQLSYPVGSPTRDAIVYAYGVAQKRMCIASTAFAVLVLIGVWIWRDIRVDNKKQVKGTVV